jgi:zinc transporter
MKSGPVKTTIVWNYHLDGHGGGQQQTRHPTIHEDRPGFDWLHLRSDDPGAVDYMRELGLDPKMIEALSAIETRPRMQLLEDGVLINLRGVNTNPGADPEDMVALRIWFNSEVIISARKHERRLLSIEDVRQSIEQGKGPKTPAEFVSAVVEKLAKPSSSARWWRSWLTESATWLIRSTTN